MNNIFFTLLVTLSLMGLAAFPATAAESEKEAPTLKKSKGNTQMQVSLAMPLLPIPYKDAKHEQDLYPQTTNKDRLNWLQVQVDYTPDVSAALAKKYEKKFGVPREKYILKKMTAEFTVFQLTGTGKTLKDGKTVDWVPTIYSGSIDHTNVLLDGKLHRLAGYVPAYELEKNASFVNTEPGHKLVDPKKSFIAIVSLYDEDHTFMGKGVYAGSNAVDYLKKLGGDPKNGAKFLAATKTARAALDKQYRSTLKDNPNAGANIALFESALGYEAQLNALQSVGVAKTNEGTVVRQKSPFESFDNHRFDEVYTEYENTAKKSLTAPIAPAPVPEAPAEAPAKPEAPVAP